MASDGQLTLYLEGEPVARRAGEPAPDLASVLAADGRLRKFYLNLAAQGLADSYEASHARLAIDCLATLHARLALLSEGKLKPLSNPVSQAAADQLYFDTARKLATGLAQAVAVYEKSTDARQQQMGRLWRQSAVEHR